MTKPRVVLIALLGWFSIGPSRASAADSYPLPKGYLCQRAQAPLVIDGKLDDAAWRDAAWTDDFVDIEGDIRPKPRFRTRVKMLWDDNAFYIAAELEEPHVWATLTKHDSVIFHDNDFEVFIDPDGDNHEYYEIEINALNTEWDLFLKKPYRDGGPAKNEWEIPGLKTATHVDGTINDPRDTDRGWSIELAIPWSVLKEYAHRPSPPRDGDQWRVNFSRVEWRHKIEDGKYGKVEGTREDNWVWSPQAAIDMHRPERWGFVQFTTKPPGAVAFRPDPAWPIRVHLYRLYSAQKDYHKEHGRYATTLQELGLGNGETIAGQLVLRTTADGYEASIHTPSGFAPGGQTWSIRQDSRLAHEP